MNESLITIAGNLVDDPSVREAKYGGDVVSFRVASTARRFDRELGRFVDGKKLFVTVCCFGTMAGNAKRSLFKGQPVVVCGALHTHDYIKDEQRRTSYEIRAYSLGHDLARGISRFERVSLGAPRTSVPTGPDGMPEDVTDEVLDQQAHEEDPFGPEETAEHSLVGAGRPA